MRGLQQLGTSTGPVFEYSRGTTWASLLASSCSLRATAEGWNGDGAAMAPLMAMVLHVCCTRVGQPARSCCSKRHLSPNWVRTKGPTLHPSFVPASAHARCRMARRPQ